MIRFSIIMTTFNGSATKHVAERSAVKKETDLEREFILD